MEISTDNRKMSASGVISKREIEILTARVLADRETILTELYQSHQEISSALLPENVRSDHAKKVELVNGSHESGDDSAATDGSPISLDDFETYFSRLDCIDKALQANAHDSKPAPVAHPTAAARKPNETIRRMGSMTDVSRSVYKTSSLMNLAKTFVEPRLPAPAPVKGASAKASSALRAAVADTRNYHVSPELLAEFNALKVQVAQQLTELDQADATLVQFEGFKKRLTASTERLNRFFQKMADMEPAINGSVNASGNGSLQCLDDEFLQRLRKLVEVSSSNPSRVRRGF